MNNPWRWTRLLAIGAASLLALAGCKDENHFVPPPPPKVSVATPVKREVTTYLELNGTAEAVQNVDLVARVQGFLQDIGYTDGAGVIKGTTLFTIEPQPYYAKLQQAQAQQAAAQAAAVQAQAEYLRQSSLGRNDFSSRSQVDQALANRDTTAANVANAEAETQVAAINYAYTRVTAPFDGVVTKHLFSIGQLVRANPATTLATIVQLDPVYVSFNVSELDALRIRSELAKRGLTRLDLDKVPVQIGLANETGYPHQGKLNYVNPTVDTSTGTRYVRAIFANTDRAIIPGNFVRVRVPTQRQPDALLVADTAIGSDQGGRYVLVVNNDNVVEQKHVEVGQLEGNLRVIEKGLAENDRIVVDGVQRAVPGSKVEPQVRTASAAN